MQLLLKNKAKVIICIKNLILISDGKFYFVILTVKFHMQFEEKTVALDPGTYV